MDRNEKDMARSGLDKLLTRIEYKTPVNSRIEEIGELLARRRAVIRRHETFRHKLVQWCVAASVVVMLVAGSLWHFSEHVLMSGDRELAYTLPDGSGGVVMPHSELSYNSFTWTLRRRVSLKGEAVFSVVHGGRFRVGTPAGRITVLGTQFRVKQHRQDMQVFCYEGFVLVETPVGKRVLVAGQKAACDTVAITLTDIPEPLPPFIPFQAVPLREVIRDIEAIFGVSVSGKEKYGDLVFTGFIITSDMDGTLEAVFHSCGIPYEISGTEILLK